MESRIPILQIIGFKNSGKTTLATKLIAALTADGIRVGSAKHDAHAFKLDEEGTDSFKHLGSGAVETVLTSKNATRIMRPSEADLKEIAVMMQGRVDIIIAEGFKSASFPKIALFRDLNDLESLSKQTSNIHLLISWQSSFRNEDYRAKLNSLDLSHIPVIHIHNEKDVSDHSISLALSLLR